jgi:hypothetical protein
VTDEKARERGQADRSPLLERDRRIVDHEAEVGSETVVWTRVLEGVEEFAQQLAELVALGLAEAREELVRVGEVLGSACLEHLSSAVREVDQGAAPVVRVGAALGEPSLDEAVDPQAHGARGETKL